MNRADVSRRFTIVVVGGVLLGAGFSSAPPTAVAAPYDQVSWDVSDGSVSWTVPDDVCAATWVLQGGSGGGYPSTGERPASPGGDGGSVSGTMSVTAGQVFTIQVGSAGENPTGAGGTGAGGTSGGFPSGGNSPGVQSGGGGGGATIVRLGNASASPVLVAGGGGGRGNSAPAGAAGPTGESGGQADDPVSSGGGGGTGSSPGAGGVPATGDVYSPEAGQPGNNLVGGDGGSGGGGGGGGYFAGGGGASAKVRSFYDPAGGGGGGGANYIAAGVASVTNSTATTQGDGAASVTLELCSTPVANLTSATLLSNGAVQLVFSFTGDDSTFTGAEFTTDGGVTWRAFSAARQVDGTWSGEILNLSPGQYEIQVRGVGTGDPSAPSNVQTVTIPPKLAATGLETGTTLTVGLLMALAGAVLLVVMRKRRLTE